nr:hypothetical protein [Tanacetum cinerariifolium]
VSAPCFSQFAGRQRQPRAALRLARRAFAAVRGRAADRCAAGVPQMALLRRIRLRSRLGGRLPSRGSGLLPETGFDFDWLEGHELSEAHWDFVYACYSNTYEVRGQTPYLTREFFSLVGERMPDAIRVVLARQGSRPVAMAFSL